MEITITRGAFGLWHEAAARHGRVFGGNLTAVLRTLRGEGYTRVHIHRGGVQRPKYETREL